MSDSSLKGSVNAKAEWIYCVDHESFISANYYYVLVMIKCNVSYVLSFLKLGTKSGKVFV